MYKKIQELVSTLFLQEVAGSVESLTAKEGRSHLLLPDFSRETILKLLRSEENCPGEYT